MRRSVYFVAKNSLTTRIARNPDHKYRNHNYRRATGGLALSCRGLSRRTKRWATYCKGGGAWKVMIVFWFDFRHILFTVFWSKSCRSLTSWSSCWTPKFPTAATTSTRSSRWRLVFEILTDVVGDWLSLAIIINTTKCSIKQVGPRVQDQPGGQDHCDLDLMLVSMDYTINDYNQKLTKLTSTRRVASTEGKRRGLSILRRWSGEASGPRYIQIFHWRSD